MFAIAGMSVFMFGMTIASDNLQKLAANRIRDIIAKLSDRPILGVLAGIALTVVVQSSGAVTSMLVGLGTAGVITLPQVMSVILGTAVGSTLTVQLLSLNITQYGLGVFTFAFVFYFLNSRRRTFKQVMGVFMGFGLLFWGLELIGIGTSELKNVSFFADFVGHMNANPLLAILVTAAFTAIVHSSAAVIGFAMSLGLSGSIELSDAVYWVYGANIGTTATALLASAGGNHIGKQVAWAHCLYKLAGVGLFYAFTEGFSDLMSTGVIQRDVANAHTVFNVVVAFTFFFFIRKGARLVERLYPPSKSDKEFSVKFLNPGEVQSTSVALAHAEREVLRMGDIVVSMVKDSLTLFEGENVDLKDSVRERDDRVDLLNREINLFLAQYADEASSITQRQLMRLMSFTADLESVGDVIDNTLLDLARKKHDLKLEFSDEGWQDLRAIHKAVEDVATQSVSCFQRQDKELASKVLFIKRSVRKMEAEFRQKHMERLVKGDKDAIVTSSIHIDVLSEYRRMVGLFSNHVYGLLKANDKYNILPRRES